MAQPKLGRQAHSHALARKVLRMRKKRPYFAILRAFAQVMAGALAPLSYCELPLMMERPLASRLAITQVGAFVPPPFS